MKNKNMTRNGLLREKEKLLHDLEERNKELHLLYEVSMLSSKTDLSLKDFLQKSVDLIPPAWHYPEITCARIIINSQKHKTKNFKKTQWSQCEDIRVNGKKLGTVEVYYLEERPELDEGPFLKEERNLIRTFSLLLSRIIERKKADKALKESEERFRRSVNLAPFPIMIHAEDSEVVLINDIWSEITGYQKDDIPNIGEWTKKAYGKEKDIVKKDIDRLYHKKKRVEEGEYRVQTKKGTERIWEFSSTPLGKTSDNRRLVLSMAHDITRRKQFEEALKESESKFRDIFETADIGIAYSSLGGKVVQVNKALEGILGIPSIEIVGKNMITLTKKFLSLKNAKQILPIIKDILKGRKVRPFEVNYKDKVLEVSSTYNPESKRITGLIKDITEKRNAEEQIKKSLQEKEILLKEIHHRVKNNMQVISSLINIQSMRIKDPKAREMFKATRNRVMSMALVHERLYRSEDLAGIDFSQYIEKISVHLMSYYRDSTKNIDLKRDIEDIFLDVTKAVPLGLIINELLTNALKHAFPKDKTGEIKIKFYKKGKAYHLSISDTGVGFPKNFDFRKADSMGMDLVNSLVTQINGKIELFRDKGTTFKITFKE